MNLNKEDLHIYDTACFYWQEHRNESLPMGVESAVLHMSIRLTQTINEVINSTSGVSGTSGQYGMYYVLVIFGLLYDPNEVKLEIENNVVEFINKQYITIPAKIDLEIN